MALAESVWNNVSLKRYSVVGYKFFMFCVCFCVCVYVCASNVLVGVWECGYVWNFQSQPAVWVFTSHIVWNWVFLVCYCVYQASQTISFCGFSILCLHLSAKYTEIHATVGVLGLKDMPYCRGAGTVDTRYCRGAGPRDTPYCRGAWMQMCTTACGFWWIWIRVFLPALPSPYPSSEPRRQPRDFILIEACALPLGQRHELAI